MINDIARYRDILNRLLTEDEDDIPLPPSRLEIKANQTARKFASPELKHEIRYGNLFIEPEEEFSVGGVDGWGRLDISIMIPTSSQKAPRFFAVELESMDRVEVGDSKEDTDRIAADIKKILAILGLNAVAPTLKLHEVGNNYITYTSRITEKGLQQLAKYGFKK